MSESFAFAPTFEAAIRALIRDELRQLGLTVEINGFVQINAETIGRIVWPTLQVRLDDELAVPLHTVGVPGSGKSAVGGPG